MKNSKGQLLHEITVFDNTDGNFTGNPHTIACNLDRGTAVRMLTAYRAIPYIDNKPEHQFRYIVTKQR